MRVLSFETFQEAAVGTNGEISGDAVSLQRLQQKALPVCLAGFQTGIRERLMLLLN